MTLGSLFPESGVRNHQPVLATSFSPYPIYGLNMLRNIVEGSKIDQWLFRDEFLNLRNCVFVHETQQWKKIPFWKTKIISKNRQKSANEYRDMRIFLLDRFFSELSNGVRQHRFICDQFLVISLWMQKKSFLNDF